MMKSKRTMRIGAPLALGLIGLAGCSEENAPVAALTDGGWSVDTENSRLSYVTVKAGEIAEVNRFEKLDGFVSPDGAAMIEIDLSSVDTGVDIRNERMRDIFFEVADNPTAKVTAQIEADAFETLGIGDSVTQPLEGQLAVRGIDAPFQTDVTVTRAGPDRVIAVSDTPIIIEARDYDLLENLGQLQELAGLPSITPAVPVTFSIVFER